MKSQLKRCTGGGPEGPRVRELLAHRVGGVPPSQHMGAPANSEALRTPGFRGFYGGFISWTWAGSITSPTPALYSPMEAGGGVEVPGFQSVTAWFCRRPTAIQELPRAQKTRRFYYPYLSGSYRRFMSSMLGMGTKTKYLSTASQVGKDFKDGWYSRRS